MQTVVQGHLVSCKFGPNHNISCVLYILESHKRLHWSCHSSCVDRFLNCCDYLDYKQSHKTVSTHLAKAQLIAIVLNKAAGDVEQEPALKPQWHPDVRHPVSLQSHVQVSFKRAVQS